MTGREKGQKGKGRDSYSLGGPVTHSASSGTKEAAEEAAQDHQEGYEAFHAC